MALHTGHVSLSFSHMAIQRSWYVCMAVSEQLSTMIRSPTFISPKQTAQSSSSPSHSPEKNPRIFLSGMGGMGDWERWRRRERIPPAPCAAQLLSPDLKPIYVGQIFPPVLFFLWFSMPYGGGRHSSPARHTGLKVGLEPPSQGRTNVVVPRRHFLSLFLTRPLIGDFLLPTFGYSQSASLQYPSPCSSAHGSSAVVFFAFRT